MNQDPQLPPVGVHASACPSESQPQSTVFRLAADPAATALIPQPANALPAGSATSAVSPFRPLSGKRPRNGKIARLPKNVREIVNRMLFNRIPQEKIVGALEEIGINVTQSNISNWRTRGGYREWCLAQDFALELHAHQDNLLDSLRRHDASELPEVGLQAAATQLSRFFLTPQAAELLASNPQEYDRRISMLTRVTTQLKALQRYRDDCAKELGPRHNPERLRRDTEAELEQLRQSYSETPGNTVHDGGIPHKNYLPKPEPYLQPESKEHETSDTLDPLALLRQLASIPKPKPNKAPPQAESAPVDDPARSAPL
jgi:hypothetical protein